MSRRALAAAVVLLLAVARTEAAWSPLSILSSGTSSKSSKSSSSDSGDICTNTNLYTKPAVAKIYVCSRSVAVSQNGGGAVSASSRTDFTLSKIASQACAEAVTNGMKGVCSGADPLASISSMASTCASAIAEMQASSISGAEVGADKFWPPRNFTKTAYTTACASGCATGQTAAEAVAQASACAIAVETRGCNSVKTALSEQSYSTAFVATTAKTWSNACALGLGKSSGQGEVVAKTLVTVLSRAFGDVVAKACSECDSCKCATPPAGLNWDSMKSASDSSAAAADGRYTMSKAYSRAAAQYCTSDKSPQALKTAVDTTVNTLATIIADVYAKTTGGASATGASLACGGGSVSTAVKATKNAIVTALADANSAVFQQRCASAFAKLDGMVNMLQDKLDETFDSISNACAYGTKGPGKVNAVDIVKKQLAASDPVTAAIGMALQDAVSCGCQPGTCIWCVPKSDGRNATLVYDLGKGPDTKGVVSVPKTYEQLLSSASKLLANAAHT